jgi:amino acid transporter
MENDSLKSAWQRMATEEKSSVELKTMIRKRSDALVKRIRRQFIIETIAIAAFLIVYYDFFDGYQKPLYANILLVAALFFVMIHNALGLMQWKLRAKGENIEELLNDRLLKMRKYAIVSGILRVLVACSFLVFFISVIKFTQDKYWILLCVILVFLIQIYVVIKIWIERIRRMKEVIEEFIG